MLQRNPNIILRVKLGTAFLVDITDNYSGDRCALFELNETGRFLWERLDTAPTVEALADCLKAAIIDDVPYELLYADVLAFVGELRRKNFILEDTANG